jgi:uncharacterized protein YndB with AHSA1/START domain
VEYDFVLHSRRLEMTIKPNPVVTTQMLIRRPAAEVFEAFVDPAITTKFWFTKSTGRLEEDATVRWQWEMYGAAANVLVRELEPPKRILIEWGEPPSSVEWVFEPYDDEGTIVRISTWDFVGTPDEVLAKAVDAMGGFTSVLASLKALLEHNVRLNLVADHYPANHVPTWHDPK